MSKARPNSTRVQGKANSKGQNSQDEEEDESNLATFAAAQVDKFFVDHIPMSSLKDLPSGYMYIFGTVAYAFALATFIYFVYTSFNAARSQAFIALDQSSGDCNTVPIAITGVMLFILCFLNSR